MLIGSLLALGLASHPAAFVPAQQGSSGDDWCRDQSWGDDRQGVAEVREFTVPATGATLTVDAAPNGGISVEGSARRDIVIRACVTATARTQEEARALHSRVQVTATADRVASEGPRVNDKESWHVSYRLAVPTATPLSLKSTNGGISIRDVNSRVEFDTVNGGVKLARMGGDVAGRTSNGGLDIELDGSTWDGSGLDVQTRNGGVKLAIPANYSAHLETGTVNGHVQIDYPVTVQGSIGKSFSTDLGSGGPTVR
ncbi:MAG TPA: hypothetical protein VF147_18080, partial [Vicinamibacterales bacterium]